MRHFLHESDTAKATVLAAAVVHGTIHTQSATRTRGAGRQTYVFCAVVPFKNNHHDGFGYMVVDASVAPCEIECPDHIMRLLTPSEAIPNPGYAADWRARLATAKAAHFGSNDISVDRFTLVEYRTCMPIFMPLAHPVMRCRRRREPLATATVER